MTLADVHEGQKVKVLKVGGGRSIRQRLLDMGMMTGTIISVERYAPLRDPIHIKVKNTSLALRVSEGNMISVEKI